MSERPTPETDEAERLGRDKGCWVRSDFARKLERERDEARNLADKLARQGLDMMDESRSLTRERDEAREKMADALQEVDLRTLDFERMKQERDEARERAAQLLAEIEGDE